MATRLGEIPDKTRELVELQRYLKTSMTETLPVMDNKTSLLDSLFNEFLILSAYISIPLTYYIHILGSNVKNRHSNTKSSFLAWLYFAASRRHTTQHSSFSVAQGHGICFWLSKNANRAQARSGKFGYKFDFIDLCLDSLLSTYFEITTNRGTPYHIFR